MVKTYLKQLTKTATLLAVVMTGATQAHPDAYLDMVIGPNGGQLRMAGAYHFELLVVKNSPGAKNNALKVFVMDHANTPQTTVGATATLYMVAGQQKTSIDLKPEGANALVGEAIYSSVPDMKVVINVTLPGQSTQTVKFEPLNPKSAAAKDPVHAVTEAHDHPADNASAHSHHP